MSKLFSQLSGSQGNPPDDPSAESPDAIPAVGTNAQLELELPGAPPSSFAVPPPRAHRTRRPAAAPSSADESALRDLQTKLTNTQAALVRNEETLESLRHELAAASEARQQAQAGSTALHGEIQALKDQNTAFSAERDRFQQSLAELRAKAQTPSDFQSRQEELERQQQEIKTKIRNAEATVEQSRRTLEAEQRLRNEERQQAAARERELSEQLLVARRNESRISGALFGRAEEKRVSLKNAAIATVVALVIGCGAFLLGRHQGRPAGDSSVTADAIPPIAPVPMTAPAAIEPDTALPNSSPDIITGGGNIPPETTAATGAILPAIQVKGLQVKAAGNGLQIVFDKGVFTRRTALSDEARAILKQFARQLRPALSACRLEITGHTDPEPVRGDAIPDNQALGYQRAKTVREYLATQCFLPADALTAVATSDAGTPYPNTTPELRRKNRTVTMLIIPR